LDKVRGSGGCPWRHDEAARAYIRDSRAALRLCGEDFKMAVSDVTRAILLSKRDVRVTDGSWSGMDRMRTISELINLAAGARLSLKEGKGGQSFWQVRLANSQLLCYSV
jgi:hypothetical protein